MLSGYTRGLFDFRLFRTNGTDEKGNRLQQAITLPCCMLRYLCTILNHKV
jgi:hypothetical protein